MTVFIACDSGESITYVNATNEPLLVRLNDSPLPVIMPGESRTFSHLTEQIGTGDDLLEFVVRDEQGCLVLQRQITLHEFKEEQRLTFKILATDLPPPGERSECDKSRLGQDADASALGRQAAVLRHGWW